jgi:hypothetical protein
MYTIFWLLYETTVNQNTFTDAELSILLEKDVSDIDWDKPDDELDLLSHRNEHADPTSPVVP